MIQKEITIGTHSKDPLVVKRLGYGTMRLTGPDVWGEPENRNEALNVLKECIRNGVNFIDTADYYGEDVTNRLIAEALYPYPEDLVICTKVGATRKSDKSWIPYNQPEELRKSIDNNLNTLKIDQVTLVHLRAMPHSDVPFEKSLEAMFTMQQEGKIKHVGVSNVSVAQLELALSMGKIATVENMFGHAQRKTVQTPYGEQAGGEEVLALCEANQIPLIPYFSLVSAHAQKDERITKLAQKYGVSETQMNIAWLLHRSPWILPIPGTSSVAHLKENIQAQNIVLTQEDIIFLD